MEIRYFVNGISPKFDVSTLCEYAIWRFNRTGVAGATIRADITGINSFLTYYGYPIDLRKAKDNRLPRLYRGFDKTRHKYGLDKNRYHRRALVDKILDAMLDRLGTTHEEQVVDAMLLFAKQTAFRSHNYVYTNDGALIRIRDVTFYPNFANPTSMIVYARTKTQPEYMPGKETRTLPCRCPQDLVAVPLRRRFLRRAPPAAATGTAGCKPPPTALLCQCPPH